MKRCNNIYNHPLFRERLALIEKAETDRIFCLHDLSHALDVARIGYIMILVYQILFIRDFMKK